MGADELAAVAGEAVAAVRADLAMVIDGRFGGAGFEPGRDGQL
ncbi:MAG: hypothetical protein ABSG47_19210 [Terracidiphilus sp.]